MLNQDPLQILAVILALTFLLQIYYTLFVQLKIARISLKPNPNKTQHPVSVIVYTRNQASVLPAHLDTILEQDYPDFEVVLVNDCSWDETDDFLRDFAPQHARLKVVNVPEQDRFRTNKKFAISMGIKAAQYEHLLFNQVGAIPQSKKWIKEMQANFDTGAELLVGHTVLKPGKGLGRFFARYDLFISSLNALAFAKKGKAYLASGCNMAYLKSVFFRGKGFAAHMHIPFGEDQFFVNQHAHSKNTRVEIRPGAQVKTDDYEGFGQHVKFRLKQMRAIDSYNFLRKLMLGVQSASALLFYVFLVLLFALGFDWRLLLAAYLLRLLVFFAVYFKVFKTLGYRDLKWWFPVLDFFYCLYLFVLSVMLVFNTNSQWR
jgi:biofilm PGA synthesis N-glycosyltransferase PgaC